jgi:hypothetical protein
MKAIGYVRCAKCQGLYRGYAPRGWKPGEELAMWKHTSEDGFQDTCPGSYKPGTDSLLDADFRKGEGD